MGTLSQVRKEEKLQVVELEIKLEGDKLTGPSKSLCQHVRDVEDTHLVLHSLGLTRYFNLGYHLR